MDKSVNRYLLLRRRYSARVELLTILVPDLSKSFGTLMRMIMTTDLTRPLHHNQKWSMKSYVRDSQLSSSKAKLGSWLIRRGG